MRSSAVIILFAFCIMCAHAYPTAGIGRDLDPQLIYFPDQAEYVELSMMCPMDTILWPANRRCYREGERGPCNVGRVLVFDRRYLVPYCMDAVL